MKRGIVISLLVLILIPILYGGYRLTSFFIVDQRDAAEHKDPDDGQLASDLQRRDIEFVDPPMFTFTIFGADNRDNQLLHVALRLVVPSDQRQFMTQRLSVIQDLVNRAVYGYLREDMTGIDYREMKVAILRKLRTRFGPDVLHGVLYHMVYIR